MLGPHKDGVPRATVLGVLKEVSFTSGFSV